MKTPVEFWCNEVDVGVTLEAMERAWRELAANRGGPDMMYFRKWPAPARSRFVKLGDDDATNLDIMRFGRRVFFNSYFALYDRRRVKRARRRLALRRGLFAGFPYLGYIARHGVSA